MTRPIQEELNGVNGLIYFESTSDSSGLVQLTATFAPGTETAQAAVDVQNAVGRVEARLPEVVARQGVQIRKLAAAF